MSLYSHLQDRNSPVRHYFEDEFPNWGMLRFRDTGDVPTSVDLYGSRLDVRSLSMLGDSSDPILPPAQGEYAWAVAGAAFDYRLRYEFTVGNPATFAAAKGWTELVREPWGRRASDSGWQDLVSALQDLTTRVDPTRGALADGDEIELAQMCGLLALYEQLYRMGGIFNPSTFDTAVARAGLNQPLPSLLALVDPQLPADVLRMIKRFRSAAPDLMDTRSIKADPSFDRSRDLGGADADLILDHLLLEVKTTKHANLTARFAWQVLAYLLADTTDVYGITSVGWYFARHGQPWVFPVETFLRNLAGHEVDLWRARAEFAQVCSGLRERRGFGARVERAVDFHPPSSGPGRWHVPSSQVPWVLELWAFEREPADPACGTSVKLDLVQVPFVPPVGATQESVDPRCCRRCLHYAERLYATAFADVPTTPLADLPYFPPARGSGKWHARKGETGYLFRGAGDAPACNESVTLDVVAEPLRIPDSGDIDEADPRLCRRCLNTPPRPDHLEL